MKKTLEKTVPNLFNFLKNTLIHQNSDNPVATTDELKLVPIYSEGRLYWSVPGPIRLHSTEDIEFISDKHIILNSGQTPENERSNYTHSIWFNSDRDQYGRPVQSIAPGKFTQWVPYKHRYRTQILKNKLQNRRQSTVCGCGCK